MPTLPHLGLTTSGVFQQWSAWIAKTPGTLVGPATFQNVIVFVLMNNDPNGQAWTAHGFLNGADGSNTLDGQLLYDNDLWYWEKGWEAPINPTPQKDISWPVQVTLVELAGQQSLVLESSGTDASDCGKAVALSVNLASVPAAHAFGGALFGESTGNGKGFTSLSFTQGTRTLGPIGS